MLKTQIAPVYSDRRKKLMDAAPQACFVFFGASEIIRNHDVHYPFRQESNFLYLTDFDEPDAILVLVSGKSHLFVNERDLDREIWTGELYGIDRTKAIFQVDEVHSVEHFYAKLEELLTSARQFYYLLGQNTKRDAMIFSVLKRATRFLGRGSLGNLPVFDPAPLMAKMRVIKDPHEITLLRKATSVSARAHLHLLKRVRVGMTEFEACAEFQYFLFKNGCTDLGYGPIFASGLNATTLHYVRNNDILKHGDLLLVDAAGEVNSYTADITQTFPLSGAFSLEQKKVYEKVLGVSKACIALLKPGLTYREFHHRSAELLTEALLSLGVLDGNVKENLLAKSYRQYYPHGLGHFLGLDVHDAGIYDEGGSDIRFEPGMLITSEPGLYFRDRGNSFYGVGVRIEDDLLITENGCEVLTHELPRDVETIEQLRTIANS